MIEEKTLALLERLSEVEQRLGDPNIFDDPKLARELGREHVHLSRLRDNWHQLQTIEPTICELRELIKSETDQELLQVAREEIVTLQNRATTLQQSLKALLIPPNPDDNCNTILELRAGTGGAEAALFVADCARMYQLFSDRRGWKCELLSATSSDLGGFKEFIAVVSGEGAYRYLQYEAGTHRVQRVPATETQGRVHTSAITAAVLLEPGESDEVRLNDRDLRVDTYRSSGAGGQHVNCTDSAVRITHLPTGLVVYCQEERSQHKNKDKALRLLKAKYAEMLRREQSEKRASMRASQVGSGDRSERIRTYNFAQNRVTDHRIDLTLYQLDRMLNGELDELIQRLELHFQQKQIDELGT